MRTVWGDCCFSRGVQFEPARVNMKKVAQILIKSMMVLPRVDCSLCIAIISEAVVSGHAQTQGGMFKWRTKGCLEGV